MVKSILLAVDGSPFTESVINHGKYLAEKFNALLRILTVVDIRTYEWTLNVGSEGYMPVVPATAYQNESHKFLTERAKSLIEAISKNLEDSGLKYECEQIEGSPVEIICEVGRQVDMIVMGARGDYAKWGDSMLGATIESVSRQGNIPLLVVDKPFKEFKEIVIAYDRSDYSNKALKFAAHFANILQLPLEIISINDDEDFRKESLEEAKKYLNPFNLQTQYRHEAGHASEVIAEVTKNAPHTTLLVMGGYGHSRIREAILGSTTVQVLRKAVKPIFMVK